MMLKAAIQRFLKRETAAVAVEFALILPILLFIYLGGSYVATLASLNKKLQSASYAVANLVPYPRDYCTYRQFARNFYVSGGSRQMMGQFLNPHPVSGAGTMIQYTESAPDIDNLVTVRATVKYGFNTGIWSVVNSIAALTPGAQDGGTVVSSVFNLSATSAGVTVVKNPATPCSELPLILTGPAAVEFVVHVANSMSVQAENGVPPYRYRMLSPAPLGLTFIAETGTLTGTAQETCFSGPCNPTTTNVTFEAEDSSSLLWAGSGDQKAQKTVAVTIIHPLRLTATGGNGRVGQFFQSAPPFRQGGKPGYTYKIKNAPSGLSIDANTGVVSGWPQVPGTFTNAEIWVVDARGTEVQSNSVVFRIDPPALTAWVDGPFQLQLGQSGSRGIHASGGWGNIRVTCAGLPPGLACTPPNMNTPYNGLVTGSPTAHGSGRITITFTDGWGQTAVTYMDYNITLPALSAWAVQHAYGTAGSYVRGDVAASGGYGSLWVAGYSGAPSGINHVQVGTWQWAAHGTAPSPGSGYITFTIGDQAGQRAVASIYYSFGAPALYLSVDGAAGGMAGSSTYYFPYFRGSGGWGTLVAVSLTGNPNWAAAQGNAYAYRLYGAPRVGSGTSWLTIGDQAGQRAQRGQNWNFTAPPINLSASALSAIWCRYGCQYQMTYSASGGTGGLYLNTYSFSGSQNMRSVSGNGYSGTYSFIGAYPPYTGDGAFKPQICDNSGQCKTGTFTFTCPMSGCYRT